MNSKIFLFSPAAKPALRLRLNPSFLVLLQFGLLVGLAHSQAVDSLNVRAVPVDYNSGAPLVDTAVPLPNGQILVGGTLIRFISSANQSHTNLVRLNSDGSVDDTFGTYIPGTAVNCVALQTNGQILVGGVFSPLIGTARYDDIARLMANGALDTNFNAGFVNNAITGIVPQHDGQILTCGSFTRMNALICTGLCRLNIDGSLDTNFNAQANNSVVSIALQPDGKLLALGWFSSIGGQSRTNLARLNADGSLDTNFQPVVFPLFVGGGLSPAGGALSLQPDGKILVGGWFTSVSGLRHTNIVRLNVDGTVDTTFGAQADVNGSWGLQSVTLQTDGKILIGDDSHTLDGHPCPYLGRVNADGSLDAGFNTNLASFYDLSTAIQADGKLLVGGWFTSLGGQSRYELGRLVNTEVANQSLGYDGTNILWLRDGATPEVWRTSFEFSTNGADWTYLGDGIRISGGWQLTNVFVTTNATIRARGFATGGRYCGSSWFFESVYPQTNPTIVMNDGKLGFQGGQFGFNLSGSAGSTAVVDASADLLEWVPLATNVLPGGPMYFSDPTSSNASWKFYHVHLR